MNASLEAQKLLLEIAAPYSPERSVKEYLWVLVRRTGYEYGRLRGMYHGSVKVTGDEVLHLQRRAREQKQEARKRNEDAARSEYRELTLELRRINDRLDSIDANVGRAEGRPNGRQISEPVEKDSPLD